ncbi:MAG TPA: hypothetical protein VMI30_07220 [Stellaceae bacterium]|nr:hypothetical protein [Stellaceae bacterium]
MAGAAVALMVAVAMPSARAQSGGTPLIKIPPAQVPPVAPPATAHAPPSGTASIAPAPRALLPTQVQILHDAEGAGIAVYGALTGKAASAAGVILGVFANSEAFDPKPAIKLLAVNENDRQAQALFTATIQGTPVIGIAVAALTDDEGDVTVFYDAAAAFAASFPRLREALAQSDGVSMVELFPVRLADGRAISLPRGWQVTAQGPASVSLHGPQGEFISLGAAMPVYAGETPLGNAVLHAPCCDPVAAFTALYPQLASVAQHAGAPAIEINGLIETQTLGAPNDTGAVVLSDAHLGDEGYTYLALARTTASFTDPWTFNLSGVAAPEPVFAAELPTLLQIWRSYGGDRPGFGAELWQAVQEMGAVQAMLKSAITKRQTDSYNADPGWQPLIAAQAAGADLAPSLTQSLIVDLSGHTSRPWRIVTVPPG